MKKETKYTCADCAFHVKVVGYDENCGYNPETIWRPSHYPACHKIKLKKPIVN